MRRSKQEFLPGLNQIPKKEFGGSLHKSHPKEKRPIVTRAPIHLTLKSSLAKGKFSLLLKDTQIKSLIKKQGAKTGVKIYRIANAGNHLHLVVLVTSKATYPAFIRSISGLIARVATGRERGSAKKSVVGDVAQSDTRSSQPGVSQFKTQKRFWDFRPYTRVVSWGREFTSLKRYLFLNEIDISHGTSRSESKWLLAKVEELTRKCRLQALGFG